MKISKLLLVLSAFAVGAGCLAGHAQDNPDQAAARAALAKYSNAAGGQPAAQAANMSAPPANSEDAKAKAKADKAAAAAKAKADKAAAEAKAKQDAADLKAKQAAEKKLAEQQAKEAQATAASAKTATPTTGAPATLELDKQTQAEMAALSAAMAQRQAAGMPATNTVQTATNAPVAKAKKEKQKSTSAAQSAAPAPAAAPPGNTPDSNFAGKDLGMKPMAAPPLPIPANKQQELQDLLVKYRADQISPDEYQKERAAILAKP
jgi:colicin import membrane protein